MNLLLLAMIDHSIRLDDGCACGMEEASSIGCWEMIDVLNLSNLRAGLYIDPAGRESAGLVADECV